MTQPAPPISVPLVWAELITADLPAAVAFYGAALQWKAIGQPGSTDLTVYLDQARVAGPICGLRPRTPTDPRPLSSPAAPPDRWTVRLAPPRPPFAIDPEGDQLLRPRAPGPRFGRWAVPRALCFAELRTADLDGARRWLEGRLDAVLTETEPRTGEPRTLLLGSAVDPETPIAAVVQEDDPARAGWALAAQVPDLDHVGTVVVEHGGQIDARPVPAGVRNGGGQIILIEHGPLHGRRG